ncbi:MAG: glycoside-pentoside-hexuronide (GPH):cation symporter [Propionibacteriaceae bacterium]|jgi:sugar (glycoside-pentoside-hexuronide) transporter|nr:glycoside-pentoside-hexuronide (GPH):cation symporter [Propionibacteriaceae bacterium]
MSNEDKPKIKMGEKLGFLAFSSSNNIVYQFKSLYYLFFLTNVLLLDIFWAGMILTIGTIWDAVNDPLIGYWAVNRRFKNGERVRPFALWYSVPWAATVVLLFTDFGTNNKLTIIVSLAIYIGFEVFNTLVGIPYNSMSGLATNQDGDRRSINVFRNLGGCIGSGIGAVACLPLLRLFGALGEDGNLSKTGGSHGFFIVAVIMGTIVIIGSFIHYFTTQERVKQISDDEERLSAKRVASMLFGCKSWVLNMVYIICYGVINLLLMSCLAYYATYVLGSTSAATLIQAAYLVTSVAASFVVGAIDKRIGRRKTMMLAALISIVGKIWFIFDPFNIAAIYVNAITVGMAVTFAFVLFNTNRNNIVDIIEAKEGRRIDSMIASADNLASKLAVAGATQLVAVSLASAGYDANLAMQPDSAIGVINFMLGWAPAVVSVVMLIAAAFLTIEKDYAAITRR